ncbi:MAG: ATP synthase F1 subunit delta [Candidatus Doudnabacteria bacterium]|nr:ATP synthase F1 subunit delta [Candidatus Doudnabacteria bacterium]
MRYTAKQLACTLYEVLETTNPDNTDKVLDNFVAVLLENNVLHLYESIVEEFHKLELAGRGVKQAKVTSAKPISRENEKQVVESLNKLVQGKIEITKQIDGSLIGGVLVQVDDMVIDATVKNSLNQLKNNLKE